MESYEYYPIFRLKVFDSTSGKRQGSTELIHAKLFVIDEERAYLGSMNFTYSGFTTHYETLVRIDDIDTVRAISKEIEDIYNSKILGEVRFGRLLNE